MDHGNRPDTAPLFAPRDYETPSLFTPQNLLREARRQKGLPQGRVPAICVFDPDGDLVDFLQATGRTRHHPALACYHTALDTFMQDEVEYPTGCATSCTFQAKWLTSVFGSSPPFTSERSC